MRRRWWQVGDATGRRRGCKTSRRCRVANAVIKLRGHGFHLAVVRNDDDSAVVAVLVDVRSLARHLPRHPRVAREEGVNLPPDHPPA